MQLTNFINKDTLARVFSCEFCEIFQNIFYVTLFADRFCIADHPESNTDTLHAKIRLKKIKAILKKHHRRWTSPL